MALELKPDSDEVSRLKNEARRRMEIKEKVQTFLNRADVFFAQKLYAEALKEVNKILALDSFNHDAKEIERKISEVHAQHEEIINTLVTKLNEAEQAKDYVSAISICESLIEEDSANIRKWTSQKERLNSQRKEIEENKRKLDELKKNINNAHFDEDWIRLKLLCETYL
jgi:tetratricopeptide (TPR) repeat protein